jgi:chorismate mutase / prephenate dehydratase
MGLDDLRRRIDEVDAKILELLDERARLAQEVAAAKRALAATMHDPERERSVFEHVEALLDARPDASFPRASVRPVWREIISACLSLEQPIAVAYMGPQGTFSHMAARTFFGLSARYVEAATIPGVFDSVSRGAAEYGVVPIENSTEGGVTFTLDSLLESDVSIRNELVLDVALCLVGLNEDLGRIERVYSHPQPLAQCRKWLANNLPQAQLVMSLSTTAAAREAAADSSSLAVASRLGAELNGLKLIRENIQDQPQNATRFVVIAKSDAPRTGHDKTSLIFSTPDERGALRRVLSIFDEEGINLTRIESRPSGQKLWEYVFFTEIAGHRSDPNVARALTRLASDCHKLKVLGSYPAA